MTERNTENLTREILDSRGYTDELFYIDQQKTSVNEISALFDSASKKRNGNKGFPDFIICPRKDQYYFIIIECKQHNKHHCHQTGSSRDYFSDDDPEKYACSGVRHYAKMCHLSHSANGINGTNGIIGIAVSGNKRDELLFTTYVYNFQNYKEPVERLEPLNDIPKAKKLRELILFPNIGIKNKLGLHQAQFHINNDTSVICTIEEFHKFVINLPIFQRVVDQTHADQIFESIKEKQSTKGVIVIGVLNGQLYLVDGLHRTEAYKKLVGDSGAMKLQVELRFVYYDSIEEMADDFQAINKVRCIGMSQKNIAEMVKQQKPMADIVDTAKISTAVQKCLLYFKGKYRDFFKDTPGQCYRPHLNEHLFVEKLCVYAESRFKQSADQEQIKESLISAITQVNEMYYLTTKNNMKFFGSSVKKSGPNFDKAESAHFYIGLKLNCGFISDLKNDL